MTLEQAYNAVAGNAEVKGQGSNAKLSYTYYLNNFSFVITHGFSASGRVNSYGMVSHDAYNGAESASECYDFVKTFVMAIEKKVGQVDFSPRTHTENGFVLSKGIFTFSDSSSIKVEMSYPANHSGNNRCIINIHSGMPWSST